MSAGVAEVMGWLQIPCRMQQKQRRRPAAGSGAMVALVNDGGGQAISLSGEVTRDADGLAMIDRAAWL